MSQKNEQIESSETIRVRVLDCYNIQINRQVIYTKGKLNDRLSPDEVDNLIVLNKENRQLLESVIDKLHLSARAYHRILKVARTIADLDHAQAVEQRHLIEAIGYRRHNG